MRQIVSPKYFAEPALNPATTSLFVWRIGRSISPILWGAHYAGLYYTAVSSRLTSEELAYVIEDSGSRAFISSPYMAESLTGLDEVLGKLDLRLSVGGDLPGFDRYEDAIARESADPLPDRVEGMPMLYSSGTTGRPKGVKPALTGDPLGTGEGLTSMVTDALRRLGFIRLPLTRAPLSQCPSQVLHSVPSDWRDRRRDGTIRCGRCIADDRKIQDHS